MAQGSRSRALRVVLAGLVVVVAVGGGLLAAPGTPALRGRALARAILERAPLPRGAVATTAVPESLRRPPSVVGCSPSWDLHTTFVLERPVDVPAFVRSHLPAGATITASGYSTGPGAPTVSFVTVTLPSHQGRTAPQILYSSVSTARSTVLRLDSQVVSPTSRCVTHGPEVAVPNVVTSPIRDAMRTVASFGFAPRRVPTTLCLGPVDPDAPRLGTVAEQQPAPPAYARPGSTITLFEPTHSDPACA